MGYFGGKWSDMLIRSGISVTLSRKIMQVSPFFIFLYDQNAYLHVLFTVYDFNDLAEVSRFIIYMFLWMRRA